MSGSIQSTGPSRLSVPSTPVSSGEPTPFPFSDESLEPETFSAESFRRMTDLRGAPAALPASSAAAASGWLGVAAPVAVAVAGAGLVYAYWKLDVWGDWFERIHLWRHPEDRANFASMDQANIHILPGARVPYKFIDLPPDQKQDFREPKKNEPYLAPAEKNQEPKKLPHWKGFPEKIVAEEMETRTITLARKPFKGALVTIPVAGGWQIESVGELSRDPFPVGASRTIATQEGKTLAVVRTEDARENGYSGNVFFDGQPVGRIAYRRVTRDRMFRVDLSLSQLDVKKIDDGAPVAAIFAVPLMQWLSLNASILGYGISLEGVREGELPSWIRLSQKTNFVGPVGDKTVFLLQWNPSLRREGIDLMQQFDFSERRSQSFRGSIQFIPSSWPPFFNARSYATQDPKNNWPISFENGAVFPAVQNWMEEHQTLARNRGDEKLLAFLNQMERLVTVIWETVLGRNPSLKEGTTLDQRQQLSRLFTQELAKVLLDNDTQVGLFKEPYLSLRDSVLDAESPLLSEVSAELGAEETNEGKVESAFRRFGPLMEHEFYLAPYGGVEAEVVIPLALRGEAEWVRYGVDIELFLNSLPVSVGSYLALLMHRIHNVRLGTSSADRVAHTWNAVAADRLAAVEKELPVLQTKLLEAAEAAIQSYSGSTRTKKGDSDAGQQVLARMVELIRKIETIDDPVRRHAVYVTLSRHLARGGTGSKKGVYVSESFWKYVTSASTAEVLIEGLPDFLQISSNATQAVAREGLYVPESIPASANGEENHLERVREESVAARRFAKEHEKNERQRAEAAGAAAVAAARQEAEEALQAKREEEAEAQEVKRRVAIAREEQQTRENQEGKDRERATRRADLARRSFDGLLHSAEEALAQYVVEKEDEDLLRRLENISVATINIGDTTFPNPILLKRKFEEAEMDLLIASDPTVRPLSVEHATREVIDRMMALVEEARELHRKLRSVTEPASVATPVVAPENETVAKEEPNGNGIGAKAVPDIGRWLTRLRGAKMSDAAALPKAAETALGFYLQLGNKPAKNFVDDVERNLADRKEFINALETFFSALNRLNLPDFPWLNRLVVMHPAFLSDAAFLGYLMRHEYLSENNLIESLIPAANDFAIAHPKLETYGLLGHSFGRLFPKVHDAPPFASLFHLFMLDRLSRRAGATGVYDLPRFGREGKFPGGKIPDASVQMERNGKVLAEFKTLAVPPYVWKRSAEDQRAWLWDRLVVTDPHRGLGAKLVGAAQQIAAERARHPAQYNEVGEIHLGIRIPGKANVDFVAVESAFKEGMAEAEKQTGSRLIGMLYFFKDEEIGEDWKLKPLRTAHWSRNNGH